MEMQFRIGPRSVALSVSDKDGRTLVTIDGREIAVLVPQDDRGGDAGGDGGEGGSGSGYDGRIGGLRGKRRSDGSTDRERDGGADGVNAVADRERVDGS